MAKKAANKLTYKDVDSFERTKHQLIQLHEDINALSKKKPNDPINKFKLGFINEIITDSNKLLSEAFRPYKNFKVFDVDDLPSNSDVVMILSQYIDALEAWRSAHVYYDNYKWRCIFRRMLDTDSGACWTPIPTDAGHRFQSMVDNQVNS